MTNTVSEKCKKYNYCKCSELFCIPSSFNLIDVNFHLFNCVVTIEIIMVKFSKNNVAAKELKKTAKQQRKVRT